MKVLLAAAVLLDGLAWAISAPFINLGFDDANTNNVSFRVSRFPWGTGPVSDLLPGWDLYQGTNRASTLELNAAAAEETESSLITKQNPLLAFRPFQPDGPYALRLVGEAFLLQRADVPAGAELLTYKFQGGAFMVRANGEFLTPLPSFKYASQETHTNYLDVSKFAGQTILLDLYAAASDPFKGPVPGYLDSVAFVIGAPPPIISIRKEGTNAIVTWQSADVALLSGSCVTGPWQTITNATSPYAVSINLGHTMFFRLVSPTCTNSMCP